MKLDLSVYNCKNCKIDNQANKYASQIESLILKSQKRDLAKKTRTDNATNYYCSNDELSSLNSEIGELESLMFMAQKCFSEESNKETENLSSFYYYSTENIYLIKLYECLLELYVRVKCYSKAVCVAESLLIIYK